MTEGILYIADGREYVEEATASAENVRRQMPDVDITLATRDPVSSGCEYRFVASQGHHRVAAVASLGRRRIPVRIICPIPIEVRDVERWTQVKNGIWGRDSFKHLFDLDSREWAREHGLLRK